MGCPACNIDYERVERRIDSGQIQGEAQLVRELGEGDLYLAGGLVIYCPSCRETLERLKERIAARLRRETLAGIQDLLGRAWEERKKGRA